MTDSKEQRFNLVFSGQLLPGTDHERAKRTLAAFFGLRDVSGVSVFFSGKPVPLRRNITRGDAKRLYQQLRSVGLICEIAPTEVVAAPPPKTAATTSSSRPPPPVTAQGKAPNLFALRPAFPSQNLKQRLETTQIRGFIAAGIAIALCAVVLAVVLRFPAAPPGREPTGALAGTSLPGNELVLLVEGALLFHERSGLPQGRVSAAELGFDRIAPPLWATQNGDLLLNASTEDSELRLQRCNISELNCYPFTPQLLEDPVRAIASSLLGDTIFLLGADGQLWRSNTAGEIESEATVQLPWGRPRLLYSGGLILVPAEDGPMLGVYRPDLESFGRQLDALLVIPPTAVAKGQDRLRDVALGETAYWALLAGDEATPGLFKFDLQWGDARPVALPGPLLEPFLISWRDKVLVADAKQSVMHRLAADGSLEAPFESDLLTQERENWIEASQQRALMRQLGIGLPMILILLSAAAALLYHLSYRALSKLPQQRSALLDPMPGGVHWLPTAEKANAAIGQAGLILIASVLTATGLLSVLGGWLWLLACLPAIAGSLYALGKLREGSGGHLGLLEKHFIAVDYDGRYFYGERSALRGNKRVIIAPEIVLPIELGGLPNLSTASVDEERYTSKLKSTSLEIAGAFWLYRHPWIKAALAAVGGTSLTLSLLAIIG